MLPWNGQKMVSIFSRTQKRASTTHSRSRSTEPNKCFLEIDEAHVLRDFPSSFEFLQSAHDEQPAHC